MQQRSLLGRFVDGVADLLIGVLTLALVWIFTTIPPTRFNPPPRSEALHKGDAP